MKRFLKKIAPYLLVILFLFIPVILYNADSVGQDDVDVAIQLATRKYSFKIRKIRIGDSVGKNLWKTGYDSAKGEINLTSNQAISMLGNIFLLRSLFYYNKPDTSLTIEGYFRPSSILNSDLSQKWTRGYFLKKFYNRRWFFNEKIALRDSMMNFIDTEYLSQYKERWIYPWVFINGKCLFGGPYFFESRSFANSRNPRHLYAVLLPELKNIHFISCPISNFRKDDEWKAWLAVKKELNITRPVFLDDSFFVWDMTHLKNQYWGKGDALGVFR